MDEDECTAGKIYNKSSVGRRLSVPLARFTTRRMLGRGLCTASNFYDKANVWMETECTVGNTYDKANVCTETKCTAGKIYDKTNINGD